MIVLLKDIVQANRLSFIQTREFLVDIHVAKKIKNIFNTRKVVPTSAAVLETNMDKEL